jgi:hypothetical protein
VGGYRGRGGDGRYQLWGKQKFFALTWASQASDPRGTSIYDRAMESWNFWDQMPAQWFKFAMRHGQPVPDLELPPDSMPVFNTATGQYEGADVNAAKALANYEAGKYLIRPPGSKFNLNEPKAEGQVFQMIEEYCRRQKVLAILLSARATMEAENGSKADSETSERILDTFYFYARLWVSRAVEFGPLYLHGLYNFGPDAADAHTPTYELGDVGQQQDFAAILTALAAGKVEIIPAIWPDLYAKYKLGDVTIEEVTEYVKDKQAAAESRWVAPGTQPGGKGGGEQPGKDKAAA